MKRKHTLGALRGIMQPFKESASNQNGSYRVVLRSVSVRVGEARGPPKIRHSFQAKRGKERGGSLRKEKRKKAYPNCLDQGELKVSLREKIPEWGGKTMPPQRTIFQYMMERRRNRAEDWLQLFRLFRVLRRGETLKKGNKTFYRLLRVENCNVLVWHIEKKREDWGKRRGQHWSAGVSPEKGTVGPG